MKTSCFCAESSFIKLIFSKNGWNEKKYCKNQLAVSYAITVSPRYVNVTYRDLKVLGELESTWLTYFLGKKYIPSSFIIANMTDIPNVRGESSLEETGEFQGTRKPEYFTQIREAFHIFY